MDPWPHQIQAEIAVCEAIAAGKKRLCLSIPTGGGKTYVAERLLTRWLGDGLPTVLYTNRKLLVQQAARVLKEAGHTFGIRAAGHGYDPEQLLQISSIQTENARALRSDKWKLHNAQRVIIDEAHLIRGRTACELLAEHAIHGAVYLGLTATPIDLGDLYDDLIVCGTTSELRACGALLVAKHYGPDEPDLRAFKVKAGADFSEKQLKKAFPMGQPLFGRVFDWFRRLNPESKPTILFAAGVEESMWFAQEFVKQGITAAHIDGQAAWVNGDFVKGREARDQILEGSKNGEIKVLCNRFVLREGIDCPWLAHGIFATAFGSLQTYLQSGGRLLRTHPGLSHVTIQDHGGCLDTDTEILTARGWVGHDAIQDNDTVAAYDRFNGHILWKPILQRHERLLGPGEQMYEAQGRSINLRITGNHRLLMHKRFNTDAGGKGWPETFEFARADELSATNWRFRIPIAGIQDSPGVQLSDDELRFIGWFLTDGTQSGARQAVSFTQANHQPQIADLRACLNGCGLDFRETADRSKGFAGSQPKTKFHIPKGTCRSRPRKGWWPMRNWLNKDLARQLELVTPRQFDVLLHAIHLGDGAKDRQENSYRISTGNKTFADNLQSLAVRKGWKCNIYTDRGESRLNPLYVLNMQKVTATTLHGAETQTADEQVKLVLSTVVPGVTKVWCVANAFQTLITRRNGCVAIIGNSWHRHGSLNADREWVLDATAGLYHGLRDERIRSGKEREPSRCPQCGLVVNVRVCPCGHEMRPGRKSRPVVMSDGTLHDLAGDILKPKRTAMKKNTAMLWTRMYFRARNGNMTFRQAEALFAIENHYYPPRTLKLMPQNEWDFCRRVKDVPKERLS